MTFPPALVWQIVVTQFVDGKRCVFDPDQKLAKYCATLQGGIVRRGTSMSRLTRIVPLPPGPPATRREQREATDAMQAFQGPVGAFSGADRGFPGRTAGGMRARGGCGAPPPVFQNGGISTMTSCLDIVLILQCPLVSELPHTADSP